VSGIAANNWATAYSSGDVNAAPVTRSIYDAGHRITATVAFPVRLARSLTSTASVYYNSQSGRPYVLVFNGDANGDGRPNDDIVFAPASPDQVTVVNGTSAQLDEYLRGDSSTSDFRGRIPPRNSGRAPWSHTLNARYLVTVPAGGKAKLELTMDVVNVLNLLNKNWGEVLYPNVNGPMTIGWVGFDKTSGREILNLSTITAATFAGTLNRDDLRSRWQAQWGVRVGF